MRKRMLVLRWRAGFSVALAAALAGVAAIASAQPAGAQIADEAIYTFFRTEKLEYQRDEDANDFFVWDAQGWVGGDFNKLWMKTEGEYAFEQDELEGAELQLLYSRFIGAFWDAQIGVRSDFEPEQTFDAVIGVQGLAPYFFEIDAAMFVSEDGDVLGRIEAAYELLLTQRLIAEPRIELDLAAQDIEERDTAKGLSGLEAGIRLRYEIIREVAPYVGFEYVRDEAASGSEKNSYRFVTGLQLWF